VHSKTEDQLVVFAQGVKTSLLQYTPSFYVRTYLEIWKRRTPRLSMLRLGSRLGDGAALRVRGRGPGIWVIKGIKILGLGF
jgi:hypothetical protein